MFATVEDLKQSILPMLERILEQPNADLMVSIENLASQYQSMWQFSDELKDQLVNELKTNFNTTVSIPGILRKKDGFKPWIGNKHGLKWLQWNRYKNYLRRVKSWPENVVQSLDETSNLILDHLFDPEIKDQEFDKRGLVVGYVQSGKTASFTSVINKAFDTGYKIVIVLAGMHNSLRSQTQIRLDEEVIGYTMTGSHTDESVVGVGRLRGFESMNITAVTNRSEHGDFEAKKAATMFHPPILLVVKKNKTVLTRLLNYLQRNSEIAEWANGLNKNKIVSNLPMLMIDDEADQATVNTSEIYDEDDKILDEYNPSTINRLIREIFHTFQQRAYVGYTATPFANILIDRTSFTEEHGYDMFPRDFILSLPKPSNYAGPAEYFGIFEDPDKQQNSLVRLVKEDEGFLPRKNPKKTDVPTYLPESLIESIYSYFVATAIRRARGQANSHSSMLIHVTRFVDVQNKVHNLVNQLVEEIKNEVIYDASNSDHLELIRKLYESDFIDTSNSREDGGDTFSWDLIRLEIIETLKKVEVMEINGKSDDVLSYEKHKDGFYVIAIGGDKLSRGLTLDGLSVSYYLRTSKTYDTLMQMGRWFGYRDGYFDLCRIYTTSELANWFYHIAVATEELRAQLLQMAEDNKTPDDYLLSINMHPDMQITSTMKMRSARSVKVSYSTSLVQTTIFDKKKEFFVENHNAVQQFLKRLGGNQTAKVGKKNSNDTSAVVSQKENYIYWENVQIVDILYFLEHYHTSNSLFRADVDSLRDYINHCNVEANELSSWTVVIVNPKGNKVTKIADVEVNGRVKRVGEKNGFDKSTDHFSIRILTSEGHEFLDYSSEQESNALNLIKNPEGENKRKEKANLYIQARALRNPQKGLLLLYPLDTSSGVMFEAKEKLGLGEQIIPFGFAISFPRSSAESSLKDYVVNKSI